MGTIENRIDGGEVMSDLRTTLPPVDFFFRENINNIPESPTDMTIENLNQQKELTPLTNVLPAGPTAKGIFDQYLNIKKEPDLNSWKYSEPQQWNQNNVMDFIYYIAGKYYEITGTIRGENFQGMRGEELCQKSLDELNRLEPDFGQPIFDELRNIQTTGQAYYQSNYPGYFPPEAMDLRDSLILSELGEDEIQRDEYLPFSECTAPIPNMPDFTMDVGTTNGSTITYDFNINDDFEGINQPESGYDSSASKSSMDDHAIDEDDGYGPEIPRTVPETVMNCSTQFGRFEMPSTVATQTSNLPGYTYTKDDGIPKKRKAGRPRLKKISEGSDDSSIDDAPVQKQRRGRKLGQMSKGNHLWEFIRDLLMDQQYNPHIIRWEDRNEGVFRIVKSNEVSKLWGKKKNNINMNYEKLSRALRFSRGEKYFGDVPKDGRFPKKLCFKFGVRSFGWK